ncbi:MAG: ATP-binding protein [Muribaculaceae bacterium]|nr:ATP-binding protein [Muribaculaceae bacterium]
MANYRPVQLSETQAKKFEPQAKMMAANGIAQSLSFTSERKYLNNISDRSTPFTLTVPDKHRIDSPAEPFWIKISQIGKPIEDSAENCFTAIQKILTSCFLPREAQLIFIVNGDNGNFNLFLGIRPLDKDAITTKFADNLCNFISGVWPGLKCSREKGNLEDIKKQVKSFDFIDALTGIPSMESQYKTVYPATIDTLMSGMRNKDFAYMVIAEPLPSNDIDGILYRCRDFNGKAESLKSFNFSENMSSSIGKTISDAHTVTEGTSVTDGKSSTKKSPWGTVAAGLMLASYIFPPAGAITTAISTAGAILEGANTIAGSNLIGDFTPTTTKSHSETKSNSVSDTHTESDTFTEQQGQAISHNVVNKQIEATSEHLFYHSKRFETGKAIGCWSVGVYLLSDSRYDLQSASMQLKSIVSGQESIFEPIRIHHIQDVVDEILPQTLGSMDAPLIKIGTPNGFFQHPLGEHFNDLRTVLTTKELSYFINFPLRTVPGVSVVDSSPEFCLNEQKTTGIPFGNLLYGGSVTRLKYRIPVSALSRHTLISGINGSGKTNTVQAILNGIGRLPFLVIEPAKTEYVDWALEYNRANPASPISIYMPGCNKYRGKFTPNKLKLNPFEIVWLNKEQEPNVLSHIDRLKSTFAAAFPMYDILPVLMEDLIYSIYQNKSTDWLNQIPIFGKTLPPTLNSMSFGVDKVIGGRGYEQRVEQNMKACLNTRIDSLKRGWKGEMLNTIKSTPWKDLFERPVIINLSYVGDDVDKGFFMSLILQFLYEYVAAKGEIGQIDFNSNECNHLTIIEEAHRVMTKCDNMELPQYKTAQMFSNMLSEIRAYGEGMILVDQVPTRLIPDAIKNTNLKIVHRLVAEDDSKALAESLSLTDTQRKLIPKLLTGQCIVSSSLSTDIYWVKADKVK